MTVARRIQLTRVFLSAAAIAGSALVFVALAGLYPPYGVVAALGASAALLWWWRAVFSRRRVVLWLEERAPQLRFALAALVESPDTRFRAALERRVDEARFGTALTRAAAKLVGLPLALLVASQLVVRPMMMQGASVATPLHGTAGRGTAAGDAHFAAVVTAPRYARIATDTLRDPTTIAALTGSEIRFEGGWSGLATMPRRPTVLKLERGAEQRLVALAPRADSTPRVELALPARDTVLPVARGTLPLTASARDDIGLTAGWFEIILSSGSGESFTFRTAVLGRAAANGAREMRLESALRLDSLGLKPGDVVHLRAVARDANPAADAEAGSSETRTLRVFRAGDADSVSIEAALPPEMGKSELSQRMLIMMTEALAKQARTLQRAAIVGEAQKIGQDQGRLRKRVGEIIFTRLSGEPPDAGDSADVGRALADTLSPGEALLRAASAATGTGAGSLMEEEGEDSPVVAVNRPLLEAYNAMWDAERRLGVGEPREALPFMRAALAAIQRARAAERLYLRGRPPKVVVDIPRIRLSGKREGIEPSGREPRASALAAALERQARFRAALPLLSASPAAAVDSLILLRVGALASDPALAAAAERAIDDLRSGRDATAALRDVRRALVGAASSRPAMRWSAPW